MSLGATKRTKRNMRQAKNQISIGIHYLLCEVLSFIHADNKDSAIRLKNSITVFLCVFILFLHFSLELKSMLVQFCQFVTYVTLQSSLHITYRQRLLMFIYCKVLLKLKSLSLIRLFQTVMSVAYCFLHHHIICIVDNRPIKEKLTTESLHSKTWVSKAYVRDTNGKRSFDSRGRTSSQNSSNISYHIFIFVSSLSVSILVTRIVVTI